MAEPKAKVLEFTARVDRDDRIEAHGESLATPERWKPEDLVLAAIVRCSLTSLRYHARHLAIEVAGSGEASGTVTKREEDGRYAFVDVECRLDVELTPPPHDLPALLGKAERDCFVGASLTVAPRYVWNVA